MDNNEFDGLQSGGDLPLSTNLQALAYLPLGLYDIALRIRNEEINRLNEEREKFPSDGKNKPFRLSYQHSFQPLQGIEGLFCCYFGWFSTTLINFLRLSHLKRLADANSWGLSELDDPNIRSRISKETLDYAKSKAPEVYQWRNKVSAHPALVDPRQDSIGTLDLSVLVNISYHSPYFKAGFINRKHSKGSSKLKPWALTKVYDILTNEYWPHAKLPSIP